MVGTIFERMFPADENGPGATEIDVVNYVDKALAGPYAEKLEWYRLGLSALERVGWAKTPETGSPNPAQCSASRAAWRDLGPSAAGTSTSVQQPLQFWPGTA